MTLIFVENPMAVNMYIKIFSMEHQKIQSVKVGLGSDMEMFNNLTDISPVVRV